MAQPPIDSDVRPPADRGAAPRRRASPGAWIGRALPSGPTAEARARRAARIDLRGGHDFLARLDAAAAAPRGAPREAALRQLGEQLSAAEDLLDGRRGPAGTPSPDVRDLSRALGPRGFDPAELRRARDAALEESTLAIPASRSELERRALDASGRPCRAWVRAAGAGGARAFARADALDTARRLALWTRHLLRESAAGRLRIPLAELDRSPLSPADLLSPGVRDHPALAALVSAQVGRVRGLLAKTREAVEDLPRPERWILSAHALRTAQLCRQLEVRGFKPLRTIRLR